jgi:predicted RNase H-like nuclease (RuvC/YqgF family)
LNGNNDCEFLHAVQNTDTIQKLSEADKMINKYQADVKTLKGEIFKLKEDVVKKKLELDKMSIETAKNNIVIKDKDIEISKLKAKFNKHMEMKNREIASLKEEMSKMAEEKEENKTLKAKDSKVSYMAKEHIYNCDQCEFVSATMVILRSHMALKHVSQTSTGISKVVGSTTISKVTCKRCKYVSTSSMMEIHVGLHHR